MPTDRTEYMKAYRADARKAGVRRVSATLSEAEYGQLAGSAKRHGERITTHLKSQALANLDRRYLVPPDISDRLDTVVAIMRGIGNNLNQLARHSNEMKYFLETEEVRFQLKRLEDMVREFVSNPPTAEG